jgi:hypothetical protein
MKHDGLRCVCNAEAKFDQSEKGVVLLARVNRSTATKALVKTSYFVERLTPKSEVPVSSTPKISTFEPPAAGPINAKIERTPWFQFNCQLQVVTACTREA